MVLQWLRDQHKVQCSPLRLPSSIPHPDGLCLACSSSLSPSPLFLLNVVFRYLWYLVESRTSETPAPSGYPMVPVADIRATVRKDAPRVEQLVRRHAPVSAEPGCRNNTARFPYSSCTSSRLLIATEGTKWWVKVLNTTWTAAGSLRDSVEESYQSMSTVLPPTRLGNEFMIRVYYVYCVEKEWGERTQRESQLKPMVAQRTLVTYQSITPES